MQARATLFHNRGHSPPTHPLGATDVPALNQRGKTKGRRGDVKDLLCPSKPGALRERVRAGAEYRPGRDRQRCGNNGGEPALEFRVQVIQPGPPGPDELDERIG